MVLGFAQKHHHILCFLSFKKILLAITYGIVQIKEFLTDDDDVKGFKKKTHHFLPFCPPQKIPKHHNKNKPHKTPNEKKPA